MHRTILWMLLLHHSFGFPAQAFLKPRRSLNNLIGTLSSNSEPPSQDVAFKPSEQSASLQPIPHSGLSVADSEGGTPLEYGFPVTPGPMHSPSSSSPTSTAIISGGAGLTSSVADSPASHGASTNITSILLSHQSPGPTNHNHASSTSSQSSTIAESRQYIPTIPSVAYSFPKARADPASPPLLNRLHCYPSSSECPSAVGDVLRNGMLREGLMRSSKRIAGQADTNRSTVVMTVAHSYHLPVVEVSLEALHACCPQRLTQWLLVALDLKMDKLCTEKLSLKYKGLTCMKDPAMGTAPIDEDIITGPIAKHLLHRWRVIELVATAVLEGFDIIHSAPGEAWAKDPIPLLEAHTASDIQVLPLSPTATCSFNSPVGVVSSNFYMLRSSPMGKEFARKWLEAGSQAMHIDKIPSFHEVKGMNMAAREFEPESQADALSDKPRLQMRFQHPRKMPGDDRMFHEYSTACDAYIYPYRSSWSMPMPVILHHVQTFLDEHKACKNSSSRDEPMHATWSPSGCHSPFVTADSDGEPDGPRVNHTEWKEAQSKRIEKAASRVLIPVSPPDIHPDIVPTPPRGAPGMSNISSQAAVGSSDFVARAAAAHAEGLVDEGEEWHGGKCAPGCYKRGTCFEELGRCDCPMGLRGADCTGASVYRGFMTGGERLRLSVKQESMRTATRGGNATVPCNKECGLPHRGACFMRGPKKLDPTCICVNGWGGSDCSQRVKTYCMGGCGGRGSCHAGFCHCNPGFYGIDCGLQMGLNGKSVRVPYTFHANSSADQASETDPLASSPVRIYVYELPPVFNVWLYSDGNTIASHAYKNGMFGSSIHQAFQPGGFYVGPNELGLHERLLSSARRTTDPDEADFFYVPTWGQVAKNVGGGITDPRFGGGMHAYWASVVKYVQDTWPYWNKTEGRDHIFVLMGDHGLCESPRGQGIPQALESAIILSNWGMFTDSDKEGFKPYLDKGPCFRPGQDIVIPSPFNSGHPNSPFRRNAKNKETWKQGRDQLLYFKGQMQWGGPGKVLLADGKLMYSHGVRQELYEWFGNSTKFPDVYLNRPGANAGRAKFCLAPAGLGFGVRVPHAIADGCIPLIIQDNVTQPFEDEFLPYSLFAVRLKEEQIPQVVDILRKYTDEQIAAMQREMECVFPYFLWTSLYGAFGDEDGHHDAFEALMGALQRRKDKQPFKEQSLCPRYQQRKETIPKAKACHMYCDSIPHGPPSEQCKSATEDVCPSYEWQPLWQPWPSGGVLQS